MGPWHYGWWWMMMPVMVVFWVAVAWFVVSLTRERRPRHEGRWQSRGHPPRGTPAGRSRPTTTGDGWRTSEGELTAIVGGGAPRREPDDE